MSISVIVTHHRGFIGLSVSPARNPDGTLCEGHGLYKVDDGQVVVDPASVLITQEVIDLLKVCPKTDLDGVGDIICVKNDLDQPFFGWVGNIHQIMSLKSIELTKDTDLSLLTPYDGVVEVDVGFNEAVDTIIDNVGGALVEKLIDAMADLDANAKGTVH